jgi:KDO2-lipid IV(A) lauroyltransferase
MPFTPKRLLEAVPIYLLYGIFSLLPVELTSFLGGWLLRRIGPHLAIHQVALSNLQLALPELAAQHQQIARDMWDNLGRTMGEYPHLGTLRQPKYLEIIGGEHVQAAVESDKTAIYFSGHLANWEIPSLAVKVSGQELALIYRQPNNRLVDRLLRHARLPVTRTLTPKGSEGAKNLLKMIRDRRPIGLLVDQKMNDGVAVPFFGHPAMTAPAIASLVQRFDLKLHPVQTERLQGPHFRVTIYPELVLNQDRMDTMIQINQLLETWIRQNPAQWLWVHRRWPDQISEVRLESPSDI